MKVSRGEYRWRLVQEEGRAHTRQLIKEIKLDKISTMKFRTVHNWVMFSPFSPDPALSIRCSPLLLSQTRTDDDRRDLSGSHLLVHQSTQEHGDEPSVIYGSRALLKQLINSGLEFSFGCLLLWGSHRSPACWHLREPSERLGLVLPRF